MDYNIRIKYGKLLKFNNDAEWFSRFKEGVRKPVKNNGFKDVKIGMEENISKDKAVIIPVPSNQI
jgi:hypothetical protein